MIEIEPKIMYIPDMGIRKEDQPMEGVLPGNTDSFSLDDIPSRVATPRRFTRGVLIAAGTGASLGAAVLSYSLGKDIGVVIGRVMSGEKPLPGDITDYVKEQDDLVAKNPEAFITTAPVIGGLAVREMARELSGLDKWDIGKQRAKLDFSWFDDHKKKFSQATPCKGYVPNQENWASTPPLDDRSFFNLTRILYSDLDAKTPRPNAASMLATLVIAQVLEASAKPVGLIPPQKFFDPAYGTEATISGQKGLMMYADYPTFNNNGKTCSLPSGLRADGVVKRDAAKRIMINAKLDGVIPDGRDGQVSAYGKLVDNLFHGDYKKLLGKQHASDQDGFYASIGQALNVAPAEGVQKGKEYFEKVLDEVSD